MWAIVACRSGGHQKASCGHKGAAGGAYVPHLSGWSESLLRWAIYEGWGLTNDGDGCQAERGNHTPGTPWAVRFPSGYRDLPPGSLQPGDKSQNLLDGGAGSSRERGCVTLRPG